MGMRNEGFVTVSMEFLAQLLHLPEGHEIVDVGTSGEEYARRQFSILCRGPTIPETPRDGRPAPQLRFEVEQKIITGRFVLDASKESS